MSIRTLLNITHDKLPKLLIDRYTFFSESINENKYGFRISKPENAPYWLQDRLILDLVYPDARHLVMTLDNLFRKYDLRLTRKLHPIISIKRNNNNKIHSIEDSNADGELVSYVYVAFEEIPDKHILDALEKELDYHMRSVQASHSDQEKIVDRLLNAKYLIKDFLFMPMSPNKNGLI